MNDPEYREQKDEARIAARHRREAEAHLESRGAAGGRGDGGLAALADTVDNREEAQVSPPRAAQQQAYPPSGAEEGRNDQGAIRDFLQERGYKPNTYEKKLLSCVVDPSAIGVGFSDLILPPSTKLALQTLVTLPLLRPKLFSHGILQKSSFTGVLLFGPPGTGKTFLAKCVARSGGARFMNVALSDVFDKYVGEGEKNVKAVFTLARKLAPCVVFIDEVDALFGRRKGDTFASRREVMNEFMGEWDGIGGGNSGVIIMAATNRPFDLDDAILRRMPRRILVDLPNEESRAKILGVHLKDEQLHDSISLVDLAKRTELYSGSDLRNLCISAALASVKENVVREARHGLPPLTDPAAEDPELRARILKEMDEIDEWSSVVGDGTAQAQSPGGSQRLLTKEHFEIALKEIPASLTDDMESLAELRKWDMQYGGAGQRKGVKPGWGFSAT
ncbi:P-loop containing nucleoside triphosphate hydrolase protein [Hyaloraphidium curvatum]|nr:P-loop containing nucleoside triphosphate hydrolase protein [Hyaloraphidium curvatum]